MNNATKRRQRLLDCYRHAGQPLATVFLPAKSDVEDAADRFEIRSKNCLSELADLGAKADLLTSVEEALAGFDHTVGAALALVAGAGEILVADAMFRPVDRLHVSLGPAPALLPLLAATQSDIAHAAVLLDREGADIWYRDDLGASLSTTTVSGDSEHIHRSHPGGWSQRRFQQIAENTWESNAKLVVDAIAEAVAEDDVEIEVVVAGGDERAVGFFSEHVPSRLGGVILVDGSRAAGHEAFLDNADVAIRSVAATRLTDAIDGLRSAEGAGRTVAGREALELAGQGRVEEVYVADDTQADDRWTEAFDFSVPLLADGSDGTHCPATDGAVALAVATGANVTVVPAATIPKPVLGVVRGS